MTVGCEKIPDEIKRGFAALIILSACWMKGRIYQFS